MTGKPIHMPRLRLVGQAAEIGPAVDTVRRFALAAGLPPESCDALALAVDEAVSNILRHAYDAPVDSAVTIDAAADGEGIEVVLADRGRPFSPLDRSPPRLEGGAADRPVGGLGIHLMRTLVDRIDYRREGDVNRLTLSKYRTAALAAGAPRGEDGADDTGA
ncbi:ATP-binding protein [Desertibaculum subflavum]|uniref:ATP-binding protein n=1 Tax=Desertibaculum subflavum TaxID=2268458 RepID=UPI0013C4430C